MALTKTVKKKTVKKTKSPKTSPKRRDIKNGRQQPKKKAPLKAASKSEFRRLKVQAPDREVIMSETEGYVTDEELNDIDEFDDTYYDDLDVSLDKEY